MSRDIHRGSRSESPFAAQRPPGSGSGRHRSIHVDARQSAREFVPFQAPGQDNVDRPGIMSRLPTMPFPASGRSRRVPQSVGLRPSIRIEDPKCGPVGFGQQRPHPCVGSPGEAEIVPSLAYDDQHLPLNEPKLASPYEISRQGLNGLDPAFTRPALFRERVHNVSNARGTTILANEDPKARATPLFPDGAHALRDVLGVSKSHDNNRNLETGQHRGFTRSSSRRGLSVRSRAGRPGTARYQSSA